ncbi:ExbD/TolR family protein [Marinobacter sp. F4206]|uniref:ExbD/TolR family protein n=1 Tax=Marinobacter sp. F4206 TaxID=2861777 RepID=UPI0027E3D340|nr:biopolymer transporter ExbD [Marinobacter sp. F4206]
MTPLIDVVFILLVFFMLTSRLSPVGFLELANASPEGPSADGQSIPELIITGNGEVKWQAQTLGLEDLITELTASGIAEVNLSTRPDTRLGNFTRTLSGLDSAGIKTHWKRATTQTP